MKVKVTATHYVEASTWFEAEKQVEQRLSDPDTIESEPAGSDPRDMIIFAIASKIYQEHNKIFFDPEIDKTYEEKLEELKRKITIWLDNTVEDVIKTNEQDWV